MSKRRKTEIDDYVEKIQQKQTEGLFGNTDLCADHRVAHPIDDNSSMTKKSMIDACKSMEEFEIKALLHNNKPTGYAQCTSERCKGLLCAKFVCIGCKLTTFA